eukprot:scaffold4744_cov426-Prasinococcus_capsulatus_cf.AAC.12
MEVDIDVVCPRRPRVQGKSQPLPTPTALEDYGTLQSQLDDAIDREDYSEAAELRDKLKSLKQSCQVEVLEANKKFYEAFQAQSVSKMREIWGKGSHVQCVHPGNTSIATREDVIESWKIIFSDSVSQFAIRTTDVRVWATPSMGYVTCVERLSAEGVAQESRIMATNIYEKQDGKWYIVMHHGSPTAPMG